MHVLKLADGTRITGTEAIEAWVRGPGRDLWEGDYVASSDWSTRWSSRAFYRPIPGWDGSDHPAAWVPHAGDPVALETRSSYFPSGRMA